MLHTIIEERPDRRAVHRRRTREDFEELQGARRGLLARGDGAGLRHRRRDHPRAWRGLRDLASASIIFWGMGISPARPRHRQCALPDRAGADHRPGRPARHRAASAARPEQRAGRVRRRPDPDVLPRLPAGRATPTCATSSRSSGARRSIPKRGLTVVEIMDAIHAGEIKGMYIMGENPAMSDPDLHHARAALAKLEHLVVQDIFLTETAWHADVVLPASALPEKTGTFTNTNRQVQMGAPALTPPGRRAAGLVDHPGARQPHGPRLDLRRTPREVFAEMTLAMPSLKQHHLGAARARGRGDLSGRRRRTSRATRSSSATASRPTTGRGAARAGRRAAARRGARRGVSAWCSRPGACSSIGTPAR